MLYALGGKLLYWTTWNSSYLWGNAFCVLVFERKERHSLQSRIRQKSSVEVLCCQTPLEGAESSAHCLWFFFSVTSDKDLFFVLPPRSEAGPAAPEPPWCRRVKTRRLQLQERKNKTTTNKKNPRIKSGISELDILKDQQRRRRWKSGVSWSGTNEA